MRGTLWSEADIEELIKNYKSLSMDQLRNKLPNRSLYAIYGMARRLALERELIKTSGEVWSESEILILKELYPKIGSDVITHLNNRSKESLYQKVSELGIRCEVIKRNTQRVQSILGPSADLAYIIGVLKGDGYVFKGKINKSVSRAYGVGLSVIHEAFANSFINSLKNIGLNPSVCIIDGSKFNPNRKKYYKIQATSINFYEWWVGIKTNYEYISESINSFENEFIRGFYESEGTVSVGGLRPKLGMCNTDEMLIDFILEIVHKQGFRFRKYGPTIRENRKPLYDILLQRKHEIPEFLSYINPCIKGGK